MKIKVTATNHFPGDTFRRIDLIDNAGRTIGIIGIAKNKKGLWESDTNGRTFQTIAEAKSYAQEHCKQFTGIEFEA